jgi:hypothetical protein
MSKVSEGSKSSARVAKALESIQDYCVPPQVPAVPAGDRESADPPPARGVIRDGSKSCDRVNKALDAVYGYYNADDDE